MISLFGSLCLQIALVFAVLQGLLPFIGYYRHNHYLSATARPCALAQCLLIAGAYVLLTIAFIQHDFSIVYVAANSHPDLPLLYRMTAVWGAHEGSILLWVLLLAIWAMVFAYAPKNQHIPNGLYSLTLAVLGMIGACFIGFLLFTSNPFLSTNQVLPGRDLNPLLQDPGLIIHPPMLYIGYVGFSVAFAITLAALLCEQLNHAWASITRRFALAAWCFLTAGIALGSWWAYRVLGWGGFWFWDPVENASLLPWLSGTALIHVLILVEKRQAAINWAILLSLICFSLSLLGTFLVRSGVLVSAHTFASDPARGIYLLGILAVLVTAALLIYIVRAPRSTHTPIAGCSREMGLLVNSALLTVAMLTVLIGTLYPLIIDALHLGVISVGAPYFNTSMAPIVYIILAAMGFAVLCAWQNQSINILWQRAYPRLLISFISAGVLLWCFTSAITLTAWLSLSLSFWVLLSVIPGWRYAPATALAHAGFAICVIGILLSSLFSQEQDIRLTPGHATHIGPYQFFFLQTESWQGPNYHGIRATFEVLKNTRHVANLYPEKRIYPVRNMVMTTVDIHPGIFRDLYIALGEPLAGEDWSVRIYYKPFVRWIWAGGILMIIGGIFAILTRRDSLLPNRKLAL